MIHQYYRKIGELLAETLTNILYGNRPEDVPAPQINDLSQILSFVIVQMARGISKDQRPILIQSLKTMIDHMASGDVEHIVEGLSTENLKDPDQNETTAS